MVDFVRQCLYCTHYTGNQQCSAFPEGISDLVYSGVKTHTVPLKGDKGIRFSPVWGGEQQAVTNQYVPDFSEILKNET